MQHVTHRPVRDPGECCFSLGPGAMLRPLSVKVESQAEPLASCTQPCLQPAHSCPHTGNSAADALGYPHTCFPLTQESHQHLMGLSSIANPQFDRGRMGWEGPIPWPGAPAALTPPPPRGCGLLREEPVPISEIRGEAVWAGPWLIELIAPFAACNRQLFKLSIPRPLSFPPPGS